MLMNVVWSSKKDDFTKAMSDLGISISEKSSLLDLAATFDEALDKNLRRIGHRTDLAEMARFSAVDAFTDICRKETGNLFGVTNDETKKALKNTPHQNGLVLLDRISLVIFFIDF